MRDTLQKLDPKSILSVRNLKTSFIMDEGTTKAVDGVSFEVGAGQVVGIVGESGCGKSVTIKSILRLIQKPGKMIAGELLFRARLPDGSDNIVDLAKLNAKGKQIRAIRGDEIALIPQEPMAALSPVYTIGNQLVEAVRLHRHVSYAQAQEIVIKHMHEVGIPKPQERLNVYSWELSGGLRQRVMIAMALLCSPRLLIADEPTTAIDVTTQAQVINLLRKLQKEQNLSMIFITHDLGVIAQIADYVVVMYLGLVMEKGPVEDIFHQPAHPYTKALLASIPSIHSPDKQELPTIGGSIPHPFNRPKGCPFYPRCSAFIPDKCNRKTPLETAIGPERSVSCFLNSDAAEQDR